MLWTMPLWVVWLGKQNIQVITISYDEEKKKEPWAPLFPTHMTQGGKSIPQRLQIQKVIFSEGGPILTSIEGGH